LNFLSLHVLGNCGIISWSKFLFFFYIFMKVFEKGGYNKGRISNTILGEVKHLFDRTDVSHVRNDIQRIIGSTVQLETNKGRHKSVINTGIISNVYPSIFTIQLCDTVGTSRKLSFSYTDVLTNAVEITLCEEHSA